MPANKCKVLSSITNILKELFKFFEGFFFSFSFLSFLRWSHCVAQSALKLEIFLSQSLEYWDPKKLFLLVFFCVDIMMTMIANRCVNFKWEKQTKKKQISCVELSLIPKISHVHTNIPKAEKKFQILKYFWYQVFQIRDTQPVLFSLSFRRWGHQVPQVKSLPKMKQPVNVIPGNWTQVFGIQSDSTYKVKMGSCAQCYSLLCPWLCSEIQSLAAAYISFNYTIKSKLIPTIRHVGCFQYVPFLIEGNCLIYKSLCTSLKPLKCNFQGSKSSSTDAVPLSPY
jgi:hypothetical protein